MQGSSELRGRLAAAEARWAVCPECAGDPFSSRNLYVEALGLPLQGEGDGY